MAFEAQPVKNEKGAIVYDAPRDETDADLVTKFLSV